MSSLRIHVYKRHLKGGAVSPHIVAAIEGFKRHGLSPILKMPGAPEPCDLAVTWGVKKPREMASGRRALVLERGYIPDRFAWTSMGFDGLSGRADFCNANSPSWRFDKFFAKHLRPWRGHEGDYVLVMGQVFGDASLANVNIGDWYRTVALRLKHAGLPAYFRNHPLNPTMPSIPNLPSMSRDVSLDEAMRNAMWVVTYNSNSGVDSMIAGIPVVAMDEGSMVWGIAGRNPVLRPQMLDRSEWARNLAFCQWSLDEIRQGIAWDHLKGGMEASESDAVSVSG